MWFKRKPPPLPEPRITLGTTGTGWASQPLTLTLPQFRNHKLIRGTTGAGKSEFLKGMCLQLLQTGEPFAFFDPHSDTGLGILAYLKDTGFYDREEAFSRLWYIKLARDDCYVPYNVLQQPYNPYDAASYIHEAIARAFPTDSTTPLLSSLLLYALVVLIVNHYPITTLVPFLVQKPLREHLLLRVEDPLVVGFFHDQYDHWTRSAIESTVRRLSILLFSPAIRFSLGQRKNILDIPAILQNGTSLIVDYGGLPTDVARLLSCLHTVGFEKAALAREQIPQNLRTPYHLIIDEAPVVSKSSAEAFSSMLDQTRKYGLFLTLAAQYMNQFDKDLHAALGNIGCEIVFRLAEEDAKASAHRFTAIDASYIRKQRNDSSLETPAQLREATALTLEQFATGQAWVRSGRTVTPIATLRTPVPQASRQDLQTILDEYARRLATPAEKAKREADLLAQPLRSQQRKRLAETGGATPIPFTLRWEDVDAS